MHARTLIFLVSLAAAALCAHAQTTLSLRHTARVQPEGPLRLGDIADLSGQRAGELAGVILFEDPAAEPTDDDGWFRVELGLIRDTIETRLGPEAGLVALRGSACDIRVLGIARSRPDAAEPEDTGPAPATADTLLSLGTVRGSVARELARLLAVSPADLRLTFQPADDTTLDTPTAGRVVQIDPIGSAARMPLRIALYEPDRLVLRESIRVDVEVRRQVAVVTRAVARRGVLTPADLRTEPRWVSPETLFAEPGVAVGAAASRTLGPGDIVESRMIEPPVLIERGDPVSVRVILDGIVLRRTATARESGRAGDIIEFSPLHDPKTRFRATVIAKGEAQVWTFRPPTPDADGHARAGTGVASTHSVK